MQAFISTTRLTQKTSGDQFALHGKALTFVFFMCSMVARLFFTCCWRSMIAELRLMVDD